MEGILFSRLRTWVLSELGPDFKNDIAKLTTSIMQFVENKVLTPLEGNEKLQLVLTWLKQLLSEVGLPNLSDEVVSLITGFVNQICSASKGELSINTKTTPAVTAATDATVTVPTPAKQNSLKKAGRWS